jgi:hypothetical protein
MFNRALFQASDSDHRHAFCGGAGWQFFFFASDPEVEVFNIQSRSESSAGETQFM